jgi:hypothetical protein
MPKDCLIPKLGENSNAKWNKWVEIETKRERVKWDQDAPLPDFIWKREEREVKVVSFFAASHAINSIKNAKKEI